MAKSLEMTFVTELGKTTKLSVDNPIEPIDPVMGKSRHGANHCRQCL